VIKKGADRIMDQSPKFEVLLNTLIFKGPECDKTAQRPTVQIEIDPNRLCASPDQIVYTLAQTRRPALGELSLGTTGTSVALALKRRR
jgi:hypothetical protein